MTPYNQTTNKSHQTEVYYVNNCQKSSSDKRFVFDVSLRDKSVNNVYTFQAMSYDDHKAWFAIMDGKELTPVLSNYSVKSDPVYVIDKNGINFIRRCIQLLEEDKLNEEGMYRKNGVSHKINQFIERNFANISSSMLNENNQTNNNTDNNSHPSQHPSTTSLIVSVLKNTIPHSNSSSTINLQSTADGSNNQQSSQTSPDSNNISRNSSSTNLQHNTNGNNTSFVSEVSEDTCTITSALKHYLIRLKEPLMTFSYNQQFLNACKIENLPEKVKTIHKLLLSLPALNYEALEMLMKHLYVVSTHSAQNKMTTSNLATCLGPTVFRTEQECVSNLYNIKFYSEIIELLIVNHEQMFQPTLDNSFLKNLIPLKSPPTMMSGATVGVGLLNNSSSASGSVSPLPITPQPPNVSVLLKCLDKIQYSFL